MPVIADTIDHVAAALEGARDHDVIVCSGGSSVGDRDLVVDTLRERGFSVFGPEAAAARLEGSKAFAKELMVEAKVPTARAETFADLGAALAYVDELGGRAVVKADGLAAGKGVTVAADRARAEAALRECLEGGRFGDAGARVVVEEVLEGPEVSAFALVDAHTVAPLALAQDFKRIGEGDTGPNTGGMGAYSPLPWVDASTEDAIWMIVGETVAGEAIFGVVPFFEDGRIVAGDGPFRVVFGAPTEVDQRDALVAEAGDELTFGVETQEHHVAAVEARHLIAAAVVRDQLAALAVIDVGLNDDVAIFEFDDASRWQVGASGELVADEREQAALAHARTLRAARMPLRKIAGELAAQGVTVSSPTLYRALRGEGAR